MKRAPTRVRRAALLLAGLLASSALHSQGAVLVVKASGGAPFTTIQDAIAAAADGDTIYVHQGNYLLLTVVGRSLTIVGAAGENVAVNDGDVRDLVASDVVVLRGLRLQGLDVSNCAGTVWIEDCQVDVDIPFALSVESSAGVALLRCPILGPDAFTDPSGFLHDSGGGARITDSIVAMFDCTVKGGNGQNYKTGPFTAPDTIGRDGIDLHGGELRLSGGSVQGGKGGNGPSSPTSDCSGSDGGLGVWMADGSPSLVVHDVAIAGGAGGAAPPSCTAGSPQPGAAGEAVLVQSGTVETVAGTARLLELGGPTIEQDVVHLAVAGVPGDVVLLLVGQAPGLVPKPAHDGVLLVPVPLLVVPLGVLGDPAVFDVPVVVPELGPGVATVHAFVQGVFKPSAGTAVLGSGSVLIALDGAY